MKIQAITLAATIATATAAAAPAKQQQLPTEISATSDLGRSLLSQSRRLDENDNDEDVYTWIAGYSLKFQGCRHHTSFNLNADDEDDVKASTTKLAHFRLCPSNSCETWLGGGCSSNYGDYVVPLATFAEAYVEGQQRAVEYQCQMYMYENCDCTEDDDKDDGFNREYCEYDCYANSKKMKDCVDRNPYDDDEESGSRDEFRAQEYAECSEWEIPETDDDDGNRRQRRRSLEEDEEEESQYYIGPYCSANGGAVYLGLYTDDTCTNFADSNNGKTTYKTLHPYAEELPYSSTSLITSDCVTCIEQEDPNRRDEEDDDNAEDQGPEVSDQCGKLYESAGKCESSINVNKSGMTSDPNTNACSYINGIKFTKVNGVVEMSTSKAATFWIVAFAMVFIGLAGVIYKLREQVEEAKKSPLLTKEDSQEDQALA
ncbi:hypothetical protein ACHAXR_009420 [Thalassiosira sp. AJA248-18]